MQQLLYPDHASQLYIANSLQTNMLRSHLTEETFICWRKHCVNSTKKMEEELLLLKQQKYQDGKSIFTSKYIVFKRFELFQRRY